MGCGVNERRLGKIKVVKFGLGGYQDMMIGVNFTLGGEGTKYKVIINKITRGGL